jgi:dihydropyrimidinase
VKIDEGGKSTLNPSILYFLEIRGLRNGTFTLFSSNHCPYVYDDPEGSGLDLTTSLVEGESPPPAGGEELAAWASDKEGNFRYIPNSCPGIETRLPLLFSKGVETGRISAEKFVELTSTNGECDKVSDLN